VKQGPREAGALRDGPIRREAMTNDFDVAIAGAGPTGLLLAGDLARAGVRCTVLERRAERSGLSRAFAVHARTLEELDARGVADELIATGRKVSELRFLGNAALNLSRLPSRFAYVLVTPQYETERVLAERAVRLGADLRYGSEVTGLASGPDAVEVQVREPDGSTRLVRAGWLVGADGMHSAVREALGMPFPGQSVVRSVMLADVRLTEPPPDALTVNTAGDFFCLIAPFGDGWYRVIGWDRSNQPPESTPVSLDEVREVTRQVLGTDFGMHDPRWLSRFHSEERQVPRYRSGRVLLAGDAAHVHSPAGGQGMNTSIQDAANLGWKLAATARGWAPEGLLDSYDAERHPVGKQVLQQSGALLRIGLTGPPPLVSARNLLAAAVTRIPFTARTLAGAMSGLGIAYPAPRDAHPLTGKRAADLPLAGSRRLYEALRDGRFVLAADEPLPPDAFDGYGDRVAPVVSAAATGTTKLVRPDGYIAWAADNAPSGGDAWQEATGTRTDEIRDALARWCGQPERPALLP
jgi:2-polyprenyl-6-methoxyphenol hydroxylase-like FAD-dependent oxidoreductase